MSFSPTLGRFIETDPEEYIDGPNLYQYERSNPVNLLDPMGLAAATTQPGGATTQPSPILKAPHPGHRYVDQDFDMARWSPDAAAIIAFQSNIKKLDDLPGVTLQVRYVEGAFESVMQHADKSECTVHLYFGHASETTKDELIKRVGGALGNELNQAEDRNRGPWFATYGCWPGPVNKAINDRHRLPGAPDSDETLTPGEVAKMVNKSYQDLKKSLAKMEACCTDGVTVYAYWGLSDADTTEGDRYEQWKKFK